MRVHGRRGRLYVAANGDTAEPVAYLSKWQLDVDSDTVDVTCRGDINRVYVSRRPTVTGSFRAWYDQATADTYVNASSGLAKRFYLYPARAAAPYWFGTAAFDFKLDSATDAAVGFDADWWPDTFWIVGTDGSFSDGFSTGFEVD
jgi:hypothetical protein